MSPKIPLPTDAELGPEQVAMLANMGSNYLNSGTAPKRWGNAHPNIVPYQTFACSDGYIIVATGNGISPNIKTQEAWVDTLKSSCQSCHALGSKGVRTVPKMFHDGSANSVQAWAKRTQAASCIEI